jgi:hypothetical protein
VRRLAVLAGCWVALGGCWLVLAGTNAGLELVAAACAAVPAAALVTALGRRGVLRFRLEGRWLARTPKAIWKVPREFVIVSWVLARHLARVRRVRSTYRTLAFPTGRSSPTAAGRRAVATLADALSPNTLPLEMDCERELVLRHELDPSRASNDLL